MPDGRNRHIVFRICSGIESLDGKSLIIAFNRQRQEGKGIRPGLMLHLNKCHILARRDFQTGLIHGYLDAVLLGRCLFDFNDILSG